MARARRCRHGGIAGLCRLLDEHAGAVEADLRRYYGANLGDLATGAVTWRQVSGWVRHLPDDSALARAQDGEAAVWGLHGQLLAGIFDQLAISNWQRAGGKGAAPRPMPRPGVGGIGGDNETRHGGPTGLSRDEVEAILHGYKTGAYAPDERGDDGGSEPTL